MGGNAWLKPNGKGFSQTCDDEDSNSICDSEFKIPSQDIDYLPLTSP